ncbi:uncharacterized protein LOC105278024 isoform X2 [Ooceraea biroi]|uniref:uncharacterized protein LOC105278024 isoform X2 n=1 Tax=Ooceraea biroi TaxID=2015173 RepID=UPI0005B966C9|nr:uncharacterized protein LOC105278024 isoform X2 [Ooceraea biroi]
MKAAAATLLIFFTRFTYLRAERESGSLDMSNKSCVFNPKLVTIVLHNEKNPDGVNIGLEQKCEEIDKTKPIAFIVHGFMSSANSSYLCNLASTLVDKRHTVFSLDWPDAACAHGAGDLVLLYANAVEHTHLVGQLLANYILAMVDQCKVSLKRIMLIGHSLGSHVSGFAAKKIHETKREKVARIFGVDPARPNFWNNPCKERLCKTDAERVIIFHSSPLGILRSIGHLDYYFRSLFLQPGCPFFDFVCSHTRPIIYMTNMVKDPSCVFPGRFKSSEPNSTTTDCVALSSNIVDLTKYTEEEGTYQLWVDKNAPHCTRKQLKCRKNAHKNASPSLTDYVDQGKVGPASFKNTMRGIGTGIVDTVEGIGESVKDIAEKVIPPCFFGVNSVSMVLFTSDIPFGKVIAPNESYIDIDPAKKIVFLVHGFISSANTSASYQLASELVQNDYTVYSLDWSEGACTTGLPVVKLTGYPSAVANTREIGEYMARYVTSVLEEGIPLDNITLIGHSLGAHVAGFAAKKIQNSGHGTIRRLFGADPAKPLFVTNSCKERICDSDADNVIIIHSSGFGIPLALGHIDLYMDYGGMQPGCTMNIVCSHTRAVEYLADMLIKGCGFPGVPVSTTEIIMKWPKAYPNSDTTDCIFASNKLFRGDSNIKQGKYYMFVNPNSPHCTHETRNLKCQQ